MLIYIVAAAEALFYFFSVPVILALGLNGLKTGAGVSVFDAGGALKRAARAMAADRSGGSGGPGFQRVWPVLRRLRFESVALTGRVAMGDAAATALVCGGLNGLGRSLRPRTARLHVMVQPDFSDGVRIELQGMLRARTGQIILAALSCMKGRIHPWKSIRSRAS